MLARVFSILILVIFVGFLHSGPARAQTSISADGDLVQAVAAAPDGASLLLEGAIYPQSLDLSGRAISLTGAEGGTRIGGENGTSLIYIDAAASVTLDRIILEDANAERAGIFLDGGTLRITNSTIGGALRFGIYATAGSSLFVENMQFETVQNGIYVLDSGNLTVSGVSFTDLVGGSISAFGADISAQVSDITVTTSQENTSVTPLVFRDGAQLVVENATIVGGNQYGIYVDNGSSLVAQDVIVDGAGTGILALNVGAVSIADTSIDGFTGQGVAIEGAQSTVLSNLHASGNGQAIGIRNDVRSLEMADLFLTNSDPEVPTLFIGTTGPFSVQGASTVGGYAGLYVQGSGEGPRVIAGSDFNDASFASGVFQNILPGSDGSQITVEGSQFAAYDGAVALVLDGTPLMQISETFIVSQNAPAISVYGPTSIDVETTAVATAGSDWAVGPLAHTFDVTSRGNVVETNVDMETLSWTDLTMDLAGKLSAAKESAQGVATITAVNEAGLPLFGDAVGILAVSSEGEEYIVSSEGYPAEIPAGTYQFLADGVAFDVREISAAQQVQIEIPDPVHPYLMFPSDDGYVRGPSLPLRDLSALQGAYEARGVITNGWTFWAKPVYGPTRVGLTSEQKTQALQEARSLYFDYFEASVLNDGLTYEEKTDEGKSAFLTISGASGVLAALGTIEDRDRLLSNLPASSGNSRLSAIEIAALIEARLGLVSQSALMDKAGQVQTENRGLAIELAAHMGALGHPRAAGLIMDVIGSPAFEATDITYSFANLTYSVLSLSSDPRVLDLFRTILADYHQMVEGLKNGENLEYTTNPNFSYYYLPMVLEYLAVNGTDEDRARLAVPLGGILTFDSSVATLLQDPVPYYLDRIGVTERPTPAFIHAREIPDFGMMVCRAIERRSASERERILSEVADLSGPHLNDTFYGEAADRVWIVGEAVTKVTTAYCNPTQRMAGAYRRDQNVLEVLLDGDESYSWGSRPGLAERSIRNFDPVSGWPPFTTLANKTVEEVAQLTANDARYATPAGRALLLHHRVIDLRYIESRRDVAQSGSDRRVFLTTLASSNGEAIVVGRVDLRPILQNGRLLVGLRLRVAYEEKGFLTPQMTGRDVAMAEALADGALKLISDVNLRIGDESVPMTYEQSGNGNIHIFAADLPEGRAGETDVSKILADLHVDVRLEVVEEVWNLNYPLYATDFAYRQRKAQP